MNVRLRRLHADYEQIKNGLQSHPAIRIRGVSGSPPDRYQIEFSIRSLYETAAGIVAERNEHVAEIYLTLAYPRQAPQCRMLTPVFHPNIAPHAVCIGDHWAAGESLLDLIVRIGEILAYQSYNTKSPLNGSAARWVDENLALLPTDSRDFAPSAWASAGPAAPEEGQCQNCRSSKEALVRCANGHLVCPDCSVACSACGKTFCLLCRLDSCAECGHLLCNQCRVACPDCGRIVCPGHVKTCALCGHAACADCVIECSRCGRPACLAHVRQCSVCRTALCSEHAAACVGCRKTLCENHAQTCQVCGGAACPDCTFACSECGTRTCLNDVAQCAVCRRVVCPTHRHRCTQCGKTFCAAEFVAAAGMCTACATAAATAAAAAPAPAPPGGFFVARCSSCAAVFRVARAHAGRRVKCPNCGAVIQTQLGANP